MPFSVKNWIDEPDLLGVLSGTASPTSTTPLNAAALEDLETRLSDYADSVGGFITSKADTSTVTLTVASGQLSATIPSTATPQLTRAGLGLAASATSPLKVGDGSGTYLEVHPDSGDMRIDVNRGIRMWGSPSTLLTNKYLDISANFALSYPDSSVDSVSRRLKLSGSVIQGDGSNGLRYRQAGGIRGAAGQAVVSGSPTTNFDPDVVATDKLAWRANNYSTTQGTVLSRASDTSLTLTGNLASAIAPGTVTVSAANPAVITGTTTLFLTHFQPGDKLYTAVNSAGITIASIASDTQMTATTTATAELSAVNYFVPWALNPDRITGDSSMSFYGSEGATMARSLDVRQDMLGLGASTAYDFLHLMQDAAAGGSDLYGESGSFHWLIHANRLGGMSGPEGGMVVYAGKQGRNKGLALHVTEANTYASYNASPFPTGSIYRQTGSPGLQVIGDGAGQPGTALHVLTRSGTTFKRALAITTGYVTDTSAGTDIFCLDGEARMGFGVTTNQAATLGARITVGYTNAGALSVSSADGIKFGDTTLYRVGTTTIRAGNFFEVASTLTPFGAIHMVGTTGATGYLQMGEITDTNPSGVGSGSQLRMYMKADKFIVQYNHGGTIKYRWLDLTSTDALWTYSTVAP